jgi:hypothetical protein
VNPETPPAGIAMANQVRRADRALHHDPNPTTTEGVVVNRGPFEAPAGSVGTPFYDGVYAEFRKAGRTLPFEPLQMPCGAPTVKGAPCKLPAPCSFHGGQP